MGRMQAEEMAELASIDVALRWHLTSNHYPPLPVELVGPAKRAIAKARAGDWESRVRVGPDLEHRTYGKLVPVWAMVEGLHLEAFVDAD